MQCGDLLILGERVIGLPLAPPPATRVIDGAGRLLLPALVDLHLHLDKAFTLPRLPHVGGDLMAAIDAFADLAAAARIAGQVAREGGVLGAWLLHHAGRKEGLAQIFRQADAHGLRLDFHVDEGQDPNLDGPELIAEAALATGFQGPVLCGHAVSLMNLSGDALDRGLDRIARAGIALCALPMTNLYLQSRSSGTPDRRGIPRLAEAAAAGITTCPGTDNVQDAFYPPGRHDPLLTLATAVPALHLDPPFGRHQPLVTTRAAPHDQHIRQDHDRLGRLRRRPCAGRDRRRAGRGQEAQP